MGLLCPKLPASGSWFFYDQRRRDKEHKPLDPPRTIPLFRASLAVNYRRRSPRFPTVIYWTEWKTFPSLPLSSINSTGHKIIVWRCEKLSFTLKKKKITKYPCVCLKMTKGGQDEEQVSVSHHIVLVTVLSSSSASFCPVPVNWCHLRSNVLITLYCTHDTFFQIL